MKTVIVKAYGKAPKGEDGKVLRDKNGKKIPGKCLGDDEVDLFESVEELTLFLTSPKETALGKQGVLADVNRQRRTDCRNSVAAAAKPKSDAALIAGAVRAGKISKEDITSLLRKAGLA